jgi:ubiquinone/menaquinone biosynthesis C-methylase UbiE
MKLHEYKRNYDLEQTYWWFVGVRAMVKTLLSLSVGNGSVGKVLDIGCGTGALLDQLQTCSTEVWGVDVSPEALKYCSLRGHAKLVLADATNIPFRSEYFDVVTAIGLIEHLEQDVEFLVETKRLLKPNGVLILLTSSFRSLWSMHDTANEHKRRYRLRSLNQRISEVGFEKVRFSHLNFFLFPIIAPMLLLHRQIYGIKSDHAERIMPIPPRAINTILTWLLLLEAKLIRWIPFPWGISMIGAFKSRSRDCSQELGMSVTAAA